MIVKEEKIGAAVLRVDSTENGGMERGRRDVEQTSSVTHYR
jgi:hypothetical protein